MLGTVNRDCKAPLIPTATFLSSHLSDQAGVLNGRAQKFSRSMFRAVKLEVVMIK